MNWHSFVCSRKNYFTVSYVLSTAGILDWVCYVSFIIWLIETKSRPHQLTCLPCLIIKFLALSDWDFELVRQDWLHWLLLLLLSSFVLFLLSSWSPEPFAFCHSNLLVSMLSIRDVRGGALSSGAGRRWKSAGRGGAKMKIREAVRGGLGQKNA